MLYGRIELLRSLAQGPRARGERDAMPEITQQAFSKARQQLKPEAFKVLYNETVQGVLAPDGLK